MTPFLLPLRSLLSRIRAALWTRRGRKRLERGDSQGAILALQTALALRPHSFEALLLLSRAYLRTRDLFRAHRTLAQARETDGARFREVAAGTVAREGFDLARLCQPSAPAAGVALETAKRRKRHPVVSKSLPYGDCRDLDEYARFRAMPPITPGEVEGEGWDDLLSDLLDD
jgi:hypothetical protein